MHEEINLLEDFAIIMAVAGLAVILFRRFGQPPILGYLLAGVLVGPFTLPFHLVEDVETIRLLADLGLVILLFALGLEFGWQRIRAIGLRVVFIGAIEISFMIALGYQLGLSLGWNSTEALFLGAAMSISSSAVLVKMLRDTRQLHETHGRLIVGILVVEDFAAVVLLSVLSGVATTGAAEIDDVWLLLGKLGLFTAAALVLGGLIAPRIVDFVAALESREVLLLAALGLAFGLAFIGESLGLSSAAGAFLIGAVLGDTRQAETITHAMEPVRDMFAAIFFVSVGMLIDLTSAGDFLLPALLVSVVFVAGKVIVDTLATFSTGQDGRTSLRVGMGMPQSGEFSLAMVKIGAEQGAVGAFLYPVIGLTTAFTALVYPFIFKSADAVNDFLARRSPAMLRAYVGQLPVWLALARQSFAMEGQAAREIQQSAKIAFSALGFILLVLGIGTFTLGTSDEVAAALSLDREMLGLAVSVVVLALCLPSGAILWRQLRQIADQATATGFQGGVSQRDGWRSDQARRLLRDSMVVAVTLLILVWATPLIVKLLALGAVSSPAPVLLLVGAAFILAIALFKLHRTLQDAFTRTFMGSPEETDDTPDRRDE